MPMADRLQRIRSILVVVFFTMGSRILGMVRDMLQTYVLPSAFFDAFDVAFTFPNLFRRLFGEGALSAAFIPVLKEEMEKGTDPTSPEVLELAGRWKELVEAFTGGDKGIERSLGTMFREEPDMARQQGFDPALFGYIGAAMNALSAQSK